MNELLEKIYEYCKLYDGTAEIESSLLTSYIDDISQIYKIDFRKNRQTNTRTSYSRDIARRLTNKPSRE
jgi:hypothetical protein